MANARKKRRRAAANRRKNTGNKAQTKSLGLHRSSGWKALFR